MAEKRAARRSCSYDAPKNPTVHDEDIIADYGRGSLYAALLMALAFGICALHWAVVA